MYFRATDIYDYYYPSECGRRVSLRTAGEAEQDTSTPFVGLLRNLGRQHEINHLKTLADVLDLSGRTDGERERGTIAAIRAGKATVYQPRFRHRFDLDGEPWELVGEPDFLLWASGGSGFLIRDSKLARNLTGRHQGIPVQLQIYGLLFERATGQPPVGLQVHAGTGEIFEIAYSGAASVLEILRTERRRRLVPVGAYEPVGWTKCAGCGYEDRCWSEAEGAQDVSLLTSVRQERARELHNRGIETIPKLLAAFENPGHRDYFWQGTKKPRPRDFVAGLRRCAESYTTGKVIFVSRPSLPTTRHYAAFDLEGLPPFANDLDRIYLWGTKVFGEQPSGYLCAQAGFGPDADRQGWFAFLELARSLLQTFGSRLPFVHWSQYERTKVLQYRARFGDIPMLGTGHSTKGVAATVYLNLVDLYAILKSSVVLPVASYSLKVVEKHVGFRRQLAEANGNWSVAKYIEATESNDPNARAVILSQIQAYNEEDLDATHQVLEWLRHEAKAQEAAGSGQS